MAAGYFSNGVGHPVDDFVAVLEHGDVRRWISRCGHGWIPVLVETLESL